MGPVFTPLGGGGARDVSAREAQGDAQAVGVIFSGGTAAVAVHGFGNQCQAEAAVFFAVQGVVALKEARQGVVGDGGCGAVVQAEGGVAAALCNGEGEGAAFRGGAESGELSSVFTFHHLKVDYKNQQKWALQPFDFAALKTLISDWQTGMAAGNAWNALFWNNHDQPRALSRFGNDREHHHASATMLASALHMLRGTPYVYQGEEIGMTNAYFDDIADYRDIESTTLYAIEKAAGRDAAATHELLRARSRDNARTPMQWTAGAQAGFTSGTPWLRVNPNHREINADAETRDPRGIYAHYRALIQLRKTQRVIQDGDYSPLLAEHPQIFAYRRENSEATLVVLANFYGEGAKAPLADTAGYQLLLGNYADSPALLAEEVLLRPYEALIYLRRK